MTKKEQKIQCFIDLEKKIRRVAIDPRGQWELWLKSKKSETDRAEIIIGAVLTQRTSWENASLALNNLKLCGLLDLRRLYVCDPGDLEKLIKPAGCHGSKSRTLIGLAEMVIGRYKNISSMMEAETAVLRQNLLGVKGVGFETADSILLYALEKPTTVIDEYARRLAVETWPADAWPKSEVPAAITKKFYLFLKNTFEDSLEPDFRVFQDFHARIVIYGQKKSAKRPAKRIQKRKN